MVLYRKYRPQSFNEVMGQDNIVNTLKNQIKLGTVSHAYLFIGSRGTGKTSIARIFAKELGVTTNDIYELDAASNNGVDEIRELTDSVSTLPLESKYKVYILDEAHMLSKSASNALLKTLEEPPKHVIFILATTEANKIQETILSRTEVYNFKKPTQEILKKAVMTVSEKEGFKIDKDSAELISILGDGSFRDTLGNLQKILSISKDKKIDFEEVSVVLGAPKVEMINNLVHCICKKDLNKSLGIIKDFSSAEVDMLLVIKMLLEKLRAVLLFRFGEKDFLEGRFSDTDMEFLYKISKDKESVIDSNTLRSILDSYLETNRSFIKELPLELALIDLLR
jgi:DNA polymerase-3 subunit gamma/tau